jgi:carboxypeptidase family protein/TonB-dependent receptor-like protein
MISWSAGRSGWSVAVVACALTLALITLVPAAASGQAVSGVVLLPDSVTPAAGVIVVATDDRGATAAKALSGARGQFTLRLPAPGRYGVTLLRIGFKPTQLPPVQVGTDGGAPRRLVLGNQPVVLSSVNVRVRETCRVGADTGLMVARVWEEARKAMVTSQLVADERPLVAEWIEYDRGMDSTARVVKEQRIRSSRNPTTHAFRSRPAAELDSTGYVVSDSSGTTYLAPDADVLLSESFAAGHCFHLVDPPRSVGASGLIGVAFQPARERRNTQEIRGTFWLDRESAELRTLEFQYTNLPDFVAEAQLGGRVEFLRLFDGHWLVSRWSVRMPRVGPRGRTSQDGLSRVVMSASNLAVRGIQITGGEVTRVMRGDSLIYAATGPSIAVQVVSRDSLVRAMNPWLSLEGTDYTATGNAGGFIRLTPVLAGRYRARVSVPLMDSLSMPPVEKEVDTRVDGRADTLALPSARDVLLAACPRDSVRSGEGMAYGRVRDERASPLSGAAVTITWQSGFTKAGTRSGDQLAYSESTIGALSNQNGYWRACGVPRGTALAVRLVSDSGSDARALRLEDDQAFGSVDLVARKQLAAANRDAAALLGIPPSGGALVEIAVSEFGGPPLPDVTVDVVTAGQTRRVVTGTTGRALIPDVKPGVLTVRARRIGYKPGELAVSVEAGRNTIPILLSAADLPTLDTVRIVGNQRLVGLRRNDEFEMRRRLHQATVSFTEDDIRLRNPVDVWQMLTNVPSLRIVDSAGVTVESTRSNVVNPDGSQSKCYVQVMVDGQIIQPTPNMAGVDLRTLPKPNEIHGVEVFAGPSTIPVQYAGTGKNKWCGMIAIWTK